MSSTAQFFFFSRLKYILMSSNAHSILSFVSSIEQKCPRLWRIGRKKNTKMFKKLRNHSHGRLTTTFSVDMGTCNVRVRSPSEMMKYKHNVVRYWPNVYCVDARVKLTISQYDRKRSPSQTRKLVRSPPSLQSPLVNRVLENVSTQSQTFPCCVPIYVRVSFVVYAGSWELSFLGIPSI